MEADTTSTEKAMSMASFMLPLLPVQVCSRLLKQRRSRPLHELA